MASEWKNNRWAQLIGGALSAIILVLIFLFEGCR